MSIVESAQSSQKKFFECLTPNVLNNLLNLFNSNTLIDDIIERRKVKGFIEPIQYKVEIYNRDLHLQVIKNNAEYFHLSFHLCPKSFNETSQQQLQILQSLKKPKNLKGPIHFIENLPGKSKQKRPALLIHVNRVQNNSDSLQFRIGSSIGGTITNEVQTEASIILEVLSDYYKKINDKYINSYVTNKHKNFNVFHSNITKEMQDVGVTRKNHNKSYENINISGKQNLRTQSSRRKTRRNNRKTE